MLAVDTATDIASVAVGDGSGVNAGAHQQGSRRHAAEIVRLIDFALSRAGARIADLDGIVVGDGPGSFTGVRLAASVTQGLAFGAGVPVVPVSDLRAVAHRGNGEAVIASLFEQRDAGVQDPVPRPAAAFLPRRPDGQVVGQVLRGIGHASIFQEDLAAEVLTVGTIVCRPLCSAAGLTARCVPIEMTVTYASGASAGPASAAPA